MPLPKSWCITLLFLLTIAFCNTHAQSIDEQTYQHKMRLMDSLSFYNMKDYDTLYRVSVVDKRYGNDYKNDYYGWIKKRNQESISFLNTNGTATEIEKPRITKLDNLPITDTTIAGFTNRERDVFAFALGNFGKNYLLSLWLYGKEKFDYSKQLLPKNDQLFSDDNLKKDFGIVYYNAMLWEFTGKRNYLKAIEFGNQLSKNIFIGYEYQKNAIALTGQLKSHPEDFKTFRVPDSLEWIALKSKLSRNEQIIFLANRLRLLNCVQPGQPAFINYGIYQFSISDENAQKLNISYWEYNPQYAVINPFVELYKMKLTPHEAELLLPYLLSDDYIASYSFHRDFMHERTLHKVSWVISSLLFEITNQ